MSNKDLIFNFLMNNRYNSYCDDCLSASLKIHPRQQVNQICKKLFEEKFIYRLKRQCSNCLKNKIVNEFAKEKRDKGIFAKKESLKGLKKEIQSNYKNFEKRVAEYLNRKFNKKFSEKSIEIGLNKVHKFDLVSENRSIFVECKCYLWTESGNYPSAKISATIETLFYFSRISAPKKILIMQEDINKKGESIVDVFVRRNDGILDDVEVWAYRKRKTNEEDEVRIVRLSQENRYKNL